MPEVKNTFLKSKMNKDLDARILPNGEYRDAQNINVSKSEGEDVGSLENVLSNIQISDIKNDVIQAELNYAGNDPSISIPPSSFEIENSISNLEIIGEAIDVKNNRIFLMLTNYTDVSSDRLSNFAYSDIYEFQSNINSYKFKAKGACCYIYMLDLNNQTNTVLVGGNFLNFSKTHKVLSINILEDLLFFSDDRNQPRKININRATNQSFSSGNPYYYNEDHISVAKFAPVLPISLLEEVALNSWQSTMQSVTQEYLPIHLIASNRLLTNPSSNTIELNRRLPSGSSSSLIQINDKLIIENDDGEEFEYIVDSVTEFPSWTKVDIVGTFQDGGINTDIDAGWAIKFQRSNPIYEQNYIGDRNVLKDKFYRFSYRFKYDDNEYSLFAPFTQEVFVPKQFGYFLDRDETKTGKSGIVSFMENLIDKVKFNIRLPYLGTDMENSLKIKEIQIVSKASDEQALKVIEDIPVADLTNTQDYIYEYNSIKPYKTLPENELTRVHDQVPIRAKCQEVTANRVIYGNYVDKHTSPDFLDYELRINTKNNISDGVTPIAPGFDPAPFSQIRKEYPNHTLKQNRSYTVGVVLMDRYGRPSNVILSKQEVVNINDLVSTIYAPYVNSGPNKVHEWPGNLLEIQFNEEIKNSGPDGYPGLYSETNPLGWYSYKVVVKQQEQEYYNVYVAGVLAGEITWSTKPLKIVDDGGTSVYDVSAGETAINQPQYINSTQTSLISLFGDNINKIPRNLNEVGATDIDFGSSVELFNRVNPNSWDDNITSSVGPVNYSNGVPYNTQSSIDNTPDTVDFIKPFKQLGDWTTTKGNAYPKQNNILGVAPFADPWYPFTGAISPSSGSAEDVIFKDPLYKSNENPFIASISTQFKTGVNPKQLQTNFGNYYYPNTGENRLGDTTLGVYETNPTESLLEIFWETSTAGLIESDSYIDSSPQYVGLNDAIYEGGGSNGPFIPFPIYFDFKESDPIGTLITDAFTILQKDGNPCNDPNNVVTITSVKDGLNNERKFAFEVVKNPSGGGPTTWGIKNKVDYAYLQDSGTRQNYTFYIQMTANGQTTNIGFPGYLSNVTPSILKPISSRYYTTKYRYKTGGSNSTFQTASNSIPINCTGISNFEDSNNNIIPDKITLFDKFDVSNGCVNTFEQLKEISYSCNFIDDTGITRDWSNVLDLKLTVDSFSRVKCEIECISSNKSDFPPQGTVTPNPTKRATLEIFITDANGQGIEISKEFDLFIYGPEYYNTTVGKNITYNN